MATLRELIIKVSANSQSFQTEIARASRMGQDYYKTMEQGGRQAAAATRETQRSIAALNAELVSAKTTATGIAGAFAGAFATHQLIQYADTWNQLSGRLRLASTGAEDFTTAQRTLMDISQRTGTSFEANATLYARIASSLRDAGYASTDVAKVTETVATSLKLSGASTEEASSVITQLSQALGSGVLRGEEFNAIMENGGRLAKLLADGLGTTVGGLRNMANNGQLTTDKIVPLLTNVELLRKEFDTLPASISGSAQKVQNSFMAWVGGANDALGASTALAGALDGLATNINTVASGAAVLAAVGGSRLLSGILSGVTSSTSDVVNARKEQIALADAQAYAAAQAQRKAVANASAATSSYNLAVAEANVAKGSNASVLAADNVIKKRSEMIAANAELVLSNRAVTASQESLRRATSSMGLLRSGASGLLSLVGGIPGALLLGAGAWYTMYQQQEQARQSAQDYAEQIDQIREKTSKMSLGDIDSNRGKTVDALVEQNRLIAEQATKVTSLKTQIDDLNAARNKPGITSENDANIVKSMGILTDQLAVEENRLNQMRDRSRTIQEALEEIERRRNDRIREQAWRQNEAYQSLLMMNGQHAEFNRLLGLGNTLLMARQGLVNVPLRIPQAALDQKQADALEKSRRDLELSRLKGEEKERARLGYAADDLGLTTDPQHQTNRAKFIDNRLQEWRNNESNKKQPKGPKTDEEKAEDVYKRLNKQQRESIALSGQNTELAKVKYQITQGELSTISDAHKQDLLRNAAALDHVNAVEKLKSLNEQLMTPEEALLNTTRERIKLLKEAAPATEEYRKTMEKISKASVQDAPKFDGVDASVGGASGELIKVADAQAELEKWHKKQLEMQKELLDEKEINEQTYADRIADINKTNADRLTDIQAGYTSASLSMFSDLAGQSAQLLQSIGQEGSIAYKTLFFASKAAAIAQAIINTELAATKAMAEGGLIMGIPAATAIRAVGYASVGLIAGQTLAGMAHDGIDRVPETGTWLLQKGERVVTASTSAKLDATLERVQAARQGAGGGTVNIHNSFTGKPDEATLAAIDSRNRQVVASIRKEMAAQVVKPSNEFGRALNGFYSRTRKE